MLWDYEDPGRWAAILARYGEVLRARTGPHGPLEALTSGTEELPAAIQGRAENHVTQPELERLLAWKLAKGRFRPRLQQLQQHPRARGAALRGRLPSHANDVPAAVMELCALQGVGPATASAVLAAGAPEVAAFMCDEAVTAVPGLPALRYTLKCYLLYLGKMQERAAALSRGEAQWRAGAARSPQERSVAELCDFPLPGSATGRWTPQKLERAL